jgi:hypothetical protein
VPLISLFESGCLLRRQMIGRDAAPTMIQKLLIAFFNGTFSPRVQSDHFRDSTKMVAQVVTYCLIRLYGSLNRRPGKISRRYARSR